MAMKIEAGENVKRGDFFFVDPFAVEVREELRGRHKPPTEENIIEMAVSMHTHGQRQAVECRRVEGNRLRLNLGFTRTAAARLIRTGFEFPDPVSGQKVEIKDEEFSLKVVVTDANDKSAFVNNVVENAHRNATSPVDDAYNQQRLRDKYGYTDPEITALYRYKDGNKVARLRRLLSLPVTVQDRVHDGTLPVQAAIDLLDLPEEKREAAIVAATGTDGAVVAARVRAVVRDHIINDEGGANGGPNGTTGDKPAPPRFKPRSLSEVRAFLQSEADTNQDENIKTFAKSFLLFIAGKRTEKFMHDQLDLLLDAERG